MAGLTVATYPEGVKEFDTKYDYVTLVMAEHVNSLQDEVVALETVIGTNPLTMVDKDPNQTTPWSDVSGRLDALDLHWTTPVFSAWSNTTSDPIGSTTTTSWGPWIDHPKSDCSANYPGGMRGLHPKTAPAVELLDPSEPYLFQFSSQAEFIALSKADALRKGGEVSDTQYRLPVSVVTTAPGALIDAKGYVTLPQPSAEFDPLGWFNGTNGFTIRKTGWYHLTGRMKWLSLSTTSVVVNGTHRVLLWAGNQAIAMEDSIGAIGSDGEWATASFMGVLTAGTTVGLGTQVFGTSEFRVGNPSLSGVFLRSV